MSRLMTTLEIVRDILVKELQIPEERVFIYNQKIKLPTDDKLIVIVEHKLTTPISSKNYTKEVAGEYKEYQELTTREEIAIEVISRGIDALERKEEFIMALYSIYSQQVQEQTGVRIFRISPINDLSELETTAVTYRFEIPVVIQTWYQRIKGVEYFSAFNGKVTAKSIPTNMVSEFEQPTEVLHA